AVSADGSAASAAPAAGAVAPTPAKARTGPSPATPGRLPSTTAPGQPTSRPSATCASHAGNAARVSSPGIGAVTVSVRLCGAAVTSALSSQSRSNWDANSEALPALNSLAVKYCKTDISKIHYSGATLTSNAYQASLRSALGQAGI